MFIAAHAASAVVLGLTSLRKPSEEEEREFSALLLSRAYPASAFVLGLTSLRKPSEEEEREIHQPPIWITA